MKTTKAIICVLFTILISQTSVNAQSPFEKLYEGLVFESPGVIYKSNGDSVSGRVRYNFASSNIVSLIGTKETFKAKEVKSFRLDSLDMWFDAVASSNDLSPNKELFSQNLTPNATKIKLYKSFITNSSLLGDKVNAGKISGDWSYELLLPGKKSTIATSDLRMSPINKKLAGYMEDCAALAKKVEDDDAYKLEKGKGLFKTKKENYEELLISILNEYSNCK